MASITRVTAAAATVLSAGLLAVGGRMLLSKQSTGEEPVDATPIDGEGAKQEPTFERKGQIWNYETGSWEDTDTAEESQEKDETPSYIRFSILSRVRDGKKTIFISNISKALHRSLVDVLPENEELHEDDPVVAAEEILRCYYPLNRLVDRLEKENGDDNEKEVASSSSESTLGDSSSDQLVDTRLLLKFLDEEFTSVTSKLQRILAQNSISYRLLPHIFQRGTEVYYMDCMTDSPEAGIVVSTSFEQGWGDTPPRFEVKLKCVNYAGDGVFVPVMTTRAIREFDKLRKIATLPVVPLQYGSPSLKQELTTRGLKFVELLGGKILERSKFSSSDEEGPDTFVEVQDLKSLFGPKYLHYDGALILPRMRIPATGRAMVDTENYYRQNPSDSPPSRSYGYGNNDGDDVNDEDMMGGVWEDSLFLCPSTVVGFAFAAKRWGRMYVDKFQPIEFDDMAYEGLVLDEDTKDMIKGLVQHGVGSGIKDLISGKGVGTIFLLHGNPGMGKTLTAEAVAELLHKPLYSVTVGELGTDASTLEYQLSDVLKIASSWKAVLLLDEADVFLERRNSADVHRNAMVGIFLRLLEYHQGILFLTTNRIASFDPAFASRINVALKYDDLQVAARTTIWRRCLQNVCGAESTEFSDSDLANLAAAELNGRQIRSIVKTAKCIATSKGVELGMRHVNIVLGVADKFTRDLKKAEEEAKQVV